MSKILLGIVGIMLLSIGVMNLYTYLQITSEPRAVELFVTDPEDVPASENIEFALMGINAPAEVEDIHSYGMESYGKAVQQVLIGAGVLTGFPEIEKTEDDLVFEGDYRRLMCWAGDTADDPTFWSHEHCYEVAELEAVIADNQVLLKRYLSLRKYDKRQVVYSFANTATLIELQHLYLASIKLALDRGDHGVIGALLEEIAFWQAALSHPVGMVERAVDMVLFGMGLKTLRHVITSYHQYAIKYVDQIDQTLARISIDGFSVEGVFIGEFRRLDPFIGISCFYDPDGDGLYLKGVRVSEKAVDHALTQFYESYSRFKSHTELSPMDSWEYCESGALGVQEVASHDALAHLYIMPAYLAYQVLEAGFAKGCELFQSYRLHVAKAKQARAFLGMLVRDRGADDVVAYLQSEAPRDEFTNKPFIYDVEADALVFPEIAGLDLDRYAMSF